MDLSKITRLNQMNPKTKAFYQCYHLTTLHNISNPTKMKRITRSQPPTNLAIYKFKTTFPIIQKTQKK